MLQLCLWAGAVPEALAPSHGSWAWTSFFLAAKICSPVRWPQGSLRTIVSESIATWGSGLLAILWLCLLHQGLHHPTGRGCSWVLPPHPVFLILRFYTELVNSKKPGFLTSESAFIMHSFISCMTWVYHLLECEFRQNFLFLLASLSLDEISRW